MESICKNVAMICGEISEEFTYSHEIKGERFYLTKISCARRSEVEDKIPVLVSERIVDINQKWDGRPVCVEGSFRSHSENSRLVLFLFAKEFEETDGRINDNYIELQGFICKETIYRKTPLGREICDVMVAVNRAFGKTDYIPCVLWGRNARFAKRMNVGDKVEIEGRMQSRRYMKKLSDVDFEERTAYEVSVSLLELIEDGENN